MTVKPADDEHINEQHMVTAADMIPGVICRFDARSSGERRPGRTLAGTTGTGDSINDDDGRVPDAYPEYHCRAGHRTREVILRAGVAERTSSYRDEKNAEVIALNARIIIRKPEAT